MLPIIVNLFKETKDANEKIRSASGSAALELTPHLFLLALDLFQVGEDETHTVQH